MEGDFQALTEATAGAVGSLLSTTILYPLDTCKTKYQAEAKEAGDKKKYRNILDVLREAYRERRLYSLYQGLPTKNVQSVIGGFVYFYSYNYVKKLYLARSGLKHMKTGANLIVAATAGAITALVTQPLDTLSARMQTAQGKAEGLLALLRERGLAQAFDGLGASLLLTSNPAIQYTVFEQLKGRMMRAAQKKEELKLVTPILNVIPLPLAIPTALTAASAFVLGALSKTVATVLTYPLIRCKVVMQRADTEEERQLRIAGDEMVGAPRNMVQAFQVIWKTEGPSGLYKGMSAQILKTVLSAALMLMIKEKVSEGTTLVMLALQRYLLKQRQAKLRLANTPASLTAQLSERLAHIGAHSTSAGSAAAVM